MRLGHENSFHAPRACKKICSMRRVHAKSRGATVFSYTSEMGKAHTISLNPGRNSHYKYQPSSFRTSRSELEQFKRKETLELRESFYLLLDFLGYVFIFSNLFLVTTCN
ncbi:hypothetical protein MtrunA17_Chr5g0415691 [Medicago truncatula]|uniref:Transmembrane protein n=1 Tax=Medicago truncatula TaxID=3880 RepID=A0A396HPJ6_MEDTR|nr:hypothetical protein MtrunA17_Chr5g0415691 [Medicago truncatula]